MGWWQWWHRKQAGWYCLPSAFTHSCRGGETVMTFIKGKQVHTLLKGGERVMTFIKEKQVHTLLHGGERVMTFIKEKQVHTLLEEGEPGK